MNRELYLSKIVDYMIEDTTWDVYEEYEDDWSYVMVAIDWPGGDREEFRIEDVEIEWPKFHLTGLDINYIINQFGISDEITIQELYNTYINKIRQLYMMKCLTMVAVM